MRKYEIENLKGSKINKLIIISEGEKISDGNKKRRTFICRCECGNEKSFPVIKLMNNNFKSCGTCRENLVGKTNGYIEITEELEKKFTNRMFRVICHNCDSEKIYSNATFNKKQHCGCLTVVKKRKTVDLKPLDLPMVKNVYTILEENIDQEKRTRTVKVICNKCDSEHTLNYYNIDNKFQHGCLKCAVIKAAEMKSKDDEIMNKRKINNRLKAVYNNMKTRCNNPSSKDYKNYGARGIKICDEWNSKESFINWAIENGYKEGLEIDREDNDRGYDPENCRWVARIINARNKRGVKLNEELVKEIRYGKWKNETNIEIANLLGVNITTIRYMRSFRTWKNI